MKRIYILSLILVFIGMRVSFAQHLFMTARTGGFGTPAILGGFSSTSLEQELGEDYNLLTLQGSLGIGRKTDIFAALHSVLGQGFQEEKFLSWSAGLHHQFIRTGLVDLAGIVRLRGNRTDNERFEDALVDFAGIISIQVPAFHPYYALVFSRPFGLDFSNQLQRSSVFGVEIPIGDIPRIFVEVSVGDRRSFGGAFKLAF